MKINDKSNFLRAHPQEQLNKNDRNKKYGMYKSFPLLLFSNQQMIVHRDRNSSSSIEDGKQENSETSDVEGMVVVTQKIPNYVNATAAAEPRNGRQIKMTSDKQAIKKTFRNHFEEKHLLTGKVDKTNNGDGSNGRYWNTKWQTVSENNYFLRHYHRKNGLSNDKYDWDANIKIDGNTRSEENKETDRDGKGKTINSIHNSATKEAEKIGGEMDFDR